MKTEQIKHYLTDKKINPEYDCLIYNYIHDKYGDCINMKKDELEKRIKDESQLVILVGDNKFEIEPDEIKDEYIFVVEPLKIPKGERPRFTIYDGQLKEFVELKNKSPEVGIYRKTYDNKATVNNPKRGNPYSLIMLRVKENNEYTDKYFKSYLASSDPGAYLRFTNIYDYDTEETSDTNVDIWPHNTLIFGAPGTGKSFSIQSKVKDLKKANPGRVYHRRVTFYEDYSYEKFVGGYLPVALEEKSEGMDNDSIERASRVSYEFRPGIFLDMIVSAWKDIIMHEDNFTYSNYVDDCGSAKNTANWILIIEEINRANAASIFGDFFQLLDRKSNGISEYGIAMNTEMKDWFDKEMKDWFDKYKEKELKECKQEDIERLSSEFSEDLRLPPNMFIWATMNSADQGVYPLDSAFKRRWSFVYKSVFDNRDNTKERFVYSYYKDKNDEQKPGGIKWRTLKDAINTALSESGNIEEDRFIGEFFFKDYEFEQMREITKKASSSEEVELDEYPNPLCDKLYAYLRQDVFRNNPNVIFNDGYNDLYSIRKKFRENKGKLGIMEVLKININVSEFEEEGLSDEATDDQQPSKDTNDN